ncbi:MAG: RnfABCDGE type electron transport complex subunit G [Deltaproteobacteria bacterium]|nr:RnfABCDGE type electron transport complex subunit G [Deltaproteobacteria bacterium]MBW2238693.1 RnfABCDGE type electron transport complex subunit G [Deltaproteobacteria bacterium]MBW2669945.1 RnfABCDGE type electron transport complex subunit G [Deltaproteobacteria bacterium]MBW2710833.1 RnfABCDGE type electron transport complex subunit G [Deltaproteobacteria bacterium]NOQ20876.1 RnfABCDGE type electron transport complex subunit G [Desulfobacterales bacterium]
MRDLVIMVVVLTVLSAFSGGLLSGLRNATAARIEIQQLKFVKGPAIKSILKGVSNDPIADRFTLQDGDMVRKFFVGKFDDKANTVVLESSGKGYSGDVGLMVAVNMEDDTIVGAAVTTHSETPGLGAMAKDNPSFVSQFKGLPIEETFKVTNDGGKVNAMSGATITSRAVCAAATQTGRIYQKLKPQLSEKLKEFNK